MKKILPLILLFFISNLCAQNGSPTCDALEPACSDNSGVKIFPNVTNQSGQGSYGCLLETPNAAWFYIKVGQAGKLDFNIIQNTAFDSNGDTVGNPIDVDFIAWGPFDTSGSNCNNLADNCGIEACPDNVANPSYYLNDIDGTNIVDCSWSSLAQERFTILNAQAGKFYVLLISNFDGIDGFIKLEQTNLGNADAGISDCSIVAGELGVDQKICNDTVVLLDATPANGTATRYSWFLDTGTGFSLLSGETSATLTIIDNVSGIYKAEVTDNTGGAGTDEVEILFFETPIAIETTAIISCDTDSNGFNEFNLSDEKDAEILNVTNPTASDFEVLYFSTSSAASTNVAGTELPSPYSLTAGNTQTIYARIHNKNNTSCFDITTFTITVTGLPVPETPSDYSFCDNTSVGSDTDGFVNHFILEDKD
ncbi:MAG: hypothetical protein ACI9JT_001212, partial [Polaribacter sp.]